MDRGKITERLYYLGIWFCLCTALLLLVLLATAYRANAQWSTDPASPLVICNAANAQGDLHTLPDGNGGWFAFWTDKRADGIHAELYGQHLDEAGHALWTANGLLIESEPDSTIAGVAPLLMPDGTLLVAYIYQPTGGWGGVIKVLHLDSNALPLWPAPLEIARGGSGPLGNISGFVGLRMMLSGNAAYVAWSYTPQGGNSRFAYELVALDGSVQFGSPGHAVPNTENSSQLSIHDDLAGGIIFVAKVGINSPLMAIRMDADGDPAWSADLQVSTNTSGLDYTYAFETAQTTMAIGNGELISVFMSGGDLPMARYDTSGTFTWTPTPFFACNESHGQREPRLVMNNGYLFMAWGDNRPPAGNEDLYVQKFDMNGTPLWAADGVAAIQTSTYIPRPDLVVSDSGGVIATFEGNTLGFAAMRMRSDGTMAWAAPAQFCTSAFNPFYERRDVLPDGEGGVVAFWESFVGDLHGARIYRNGVLGSAVGVEERDAFATVRTYPNPASDHITFELPVNEAVLGIEVLAVTGNSVGTFGRNATIDISALPSGAYTARIRTHAAIHTARFVKQ